MLTIALAYGVLCNGGRELIDWNWCLAMLGIAGLVYWARSGSTDPAPTLEPWLGWAMAILFAYVTFQLIPLPLSLVRTISPERARIADSLRPVMQVESFVPLTVDASTTAAYLFRIAGCALGFLVIRDICWRLRQWYWAPAASLIGIATFEAGLGLAQYAQGAEAQGTYLNRNHFAGLLEMILPIAAAYGFAVIGGEIEHQASPLLRALAACAALSAGTVIFLALRVTLSKTGFVAALCGLSVTSILVARTLWQGWKRWMAIAGVVVTLLISLVFFPSDELVQAYGNLVSHQWTTGEGRVPIWSDTLQLIRAYPLFGSGLGTYASAFLKYQTSEVDETFLFAHNDYLEEVAELGAAGILILATVMVPLFWKAFRAASCGRNRDFRCLGSGCCGALVAIGLHSFADYNLQIPANALCLAWILGITGYVPLSAALPVSTPESQSHMWVARFAAILGCLSIIYAPAWLVFENSFRSNTRAERIFCRFGICDTDAVVVAQTVAHGGDVAAIPLPELQLALRRNAASPGHWYDLAEAMEKSGNIEQAAYCFSRALAVGPDVPAVQLRVAEFYYGLQRRSQAFEQTTRVLAKSDANDQVIFDWYKAKGVPEQEVLAEGMPKGPRAAQSYLRYLMNGHDLAGAAAAWDWARSRGHIDEPLAREYVNYLVRNHRYANAAECLAQHLGYRGGYLRSNWMFNGDFEFDPSGYALDWTLKDLGDDVRVTLDTRVAHTGRRSLRIDFGGKENVNYFESSQTTFVTAGSYRFEAFIRAENVTTNQGVGFHIFDAEAGSRLDIRTEQVIGTTDWKKMQQLIRVPRETRALTIQVIRQPSWKFDNKIGGTVWIDTMSLMKVE